MPAPSGQDKKDETTVTLPAEWARGRDTIDKCDERIHDIRKQGLTFLTGLLTAQGVIGTVFKEGIPTQAAGAVSFTLLAFSLAVILAVRLFEKQNQLLQAAAASRCLVIESYLATELTDTITDRHIRQRWPLLTFLLYLCFGALALVLYQNLLGKSDIATVEMLGYRPSANSVFVAFVGVLILFSWIDLRPTSVRGLDWSLSKAAAGSGDVIQVRVVNLDSRPRRLPCYPQVVPLVSSLDIPDSTQEMRAAADDACGAILEAVQSLSSERIVSAAREVAEEGINQAERVLKSAMSKARMEALAKIAASFKAAKRILDQKVKPNSPEVPPELFRGIASRGRMVVETVAQWPMEPREAPDGKSAEFRKVFAVSWWKWVDSLPGIPKLAVMWGSVATLLLGFDDFAWIGLLIWVFLACCLVAAGIKYKVELAPLSTVLWPLGSLVLLGLARLVPVNRLPLPLRSILSDEVGRHFEAYVIGVLVVLGVLAVASAAFLKLRLSHETKGPIDTWPMAWRWGNEKKVCYLPPMGSFVWMVTATANCTDLRICLKDGKRSKVYLRKPIIILA